MSIHAQRAIQACTLVGLAERVTGLRWQRDPEWPDDRGIMLAGDDRLPIAFFEAPGRGCRGGAWYICDRPGGELIDGGDTGGAEAAARALLRALVERRARV